MNIFAIVKTCLLTVALTVGVSVAATSYAHVQVYEGIFSGDQESPPSGSPGIGTARVTFDLDLVTMRVQASFSGLRGLTSAAHIHCCFTAQNPNAGVATVSPSFTGFPTGVHAGTYDHTFDMAQAGSYNAPFITANGGTVSTALAALLLGLDNGRAYFNIHTNGEFGVPTGEIRAILHAVPEPETYVLMLAGLGLLAFTVARRKRG